MKGSRILIVDDDRLLRQSVVDFLAREGYDMVEAGSVQECNTQFESARPDAVVIDYFLKDGTALELIPKLKQQDGSIPIFVLTGHASVDLAVRAIKDGADQFLTKPVELRVLAGLIGKALENERTRRSQLAHAASRARYKRDPFLGNSPAIRRLAEEAHRVATSDLPILIQGETGTGKGVLAEWIHQASPRRDDAFVDINCAGLSKELLESELFGHEKGAFTSASGPKVGLLEIAHKGSAFLDEIGDMDLAIQAKLLKVVEDKKFRRLGDVRDRKVDLRLVCATHQNLNSLMMEKKFRSDLYFRVSAAPLQVPPLRERREDIAAFVAQFLASLSRDLHRPELEISSAARQALQTYHWPGNIRELRNVMERAALLSDGNLIEPKHLHFQINTARHPNPVSSTLTLAQAEAFHIAQALELTGGAVERAAVQLGIAKSTLYAKLKYYQINLAADRRAVLYDRRSDETSSTSCLDPSQSSPYLGDS